MTEYGSAPGYGYDTKLLEVAARRDDHDAEVQVLTTCAAALESIDPVARARVMLYLARRFEMST